MHIRSSGFTIPHLLFFLSLFISASIVSASAALGAPMDEIRMDVSFREKNDGIEFKVSEKFGQLATVVKSPYRFEIKAQKLENKSDQSQFMIQCKVFRISSKTEDLLLAPVMIILNDTPGIFKTTNKKTKKEADMIELKIVPHLISDDQASGPKK